MAKAIKFTTGETNLMKEFGLDRFDYTEETVTTRTNPFSGAPIQLNTFASKLYDKIKAIEMDINMGCFTVPVTKFDRLRYLFSKLFPSEYMDLLD